MSSGLIEEINQLKTLNEGTDIHNENNYKTDVEDSQSKLEKLKLLNLKVKEKAVKIFTEKCLNIHIPEEVIKLFLSLNFKDHEQLKYGLSELIEEKSEQALGIQIPKDLILSLLEVLTKIQSFKKEKNYLMLDNFIMEVLFFLLKGNLPKGYKPQRNEKQVLIMIYSLTEAVKLQDKRKLIKSLNNIFQKIFKFNCIPAGIGSNGIRWVWNKSYLFWF